MAIDVIPPITVRIRDATPLVLDHALKSHVDVAGIILGLAECLAFEHRSNIGFEARRAGAVFGDGLLLGFLPLARAS